MLENGVKVLSLRQGRMKARNCPWRKQMQKQRLHDTNAASKNPIEHDRPMRLLEADAS